MPEKAIVKCSLVPAEPVVLKDPYHAYVVGLTSDKSALFQVQSGTKGYIVKKSGTSFGLACYEVMTERGNGLFDEYLIHSLA